MGVFLPLLLVALIKERRSLAPDTLANVGTQSLQLLLPLAQKENVPMTEPLLQTKSAICLNQLVERREQDVSMLPNLVLRTLVRSLSVLRFEEAMQLKVAGILLLPLLLHLAW